MNNKTLFDTHCHLQTSAFDADREIVIERSTNANVQHILVPAIDKESFEPTLEVARHYENISCALGIHPHSANEWSEEIGQFIATTALQEPKVRAIGEIGLDYYYDFSPRDKQIEAFRAQIAIAQRLQKPIIVHTRDSMDEAIAIVEECYKDVPRSYIFGQFHCFSGTVSEMERVVAAGFFVSYTGNITFKSSTLGEVVAATPIENIMIETDSPYLTPVPHRGKRNMPEYLRLVAEKAAQLKHMTFEELMAATTTNAYRIFFPALLAITFLLAFNGRVSAQPGSRPPDSVMTKDRRDAEEMIRKQREQLLKLEEERRQDSVRAAKDAAEARRLQAMEQARKDSIKAVERIQDAEKARLKALTPMPWKAIGVGVAGGIGNLELTQSKSRITPSSVFATTFSLSSQLTRVMDVELSLNNFRVEDDLVQDRLYNLGDSTPTANLDTNKRNPNGYRTPTKEYINTSYFGFDVRFVFTPRSPLKFYAGLGYTLTTITNRQTYDTFDGTGQRLSSGNTLETSFKRGGIQALFGARYDFEINEQFMITPYAQVGAAFLFDGDKQLLSYVFRVPDDQVVFTHTRVGVTLSYGWFSVSRIF